MRSILSSLEQLRLQLERSLELVALLRETARYVEPCWAHGPRASCVFCSPEPQPGAEAATRVDVRDAARKESTHA